MVRENTIKHKFYISRTYPGACYNFRSLSSVHYYVIKTFILCQTLKSLIVQRKINIQHHTCPLCVKRYSELQCKTSMGRYKVPCPSDSVLTSQPHSHGKAAFEKVGVRVMSIWVYTTKKIPALNRDLHSQK